MAEKHTYLLGWSTEVSFIDWPMCACVLAPSGGVLPHVKKSRVWLRQTRWESAEQQVLEKYCCIISRSV